MTEDIGRELSRKERDGEATYRRVWGVRGGLVEGTPESVSE